jgi:hypothetical protein
MLELLSKGETANLLGCSNPTVIRRLGKPCAIISNGRHELPAYRGARVMSFLAGQLMAAPDEPLAFYSMLEAARRLEICRYRLKPLLGSPDCLYIADGGRELAVWSHASLCAAFQLVSEARRAGDGSYDRQRAFKRRTSARQRRRAQLRSMSIRSLMRPKPISRVRFCKPRHVWADPKAAEACRARCS